MNNTKKPTLFSLIIPYRTWVIGLVVCVVAVNILTLWLPWLISDGIDEFIAKIAITHTLWKFFLIGVFIFIGTYVQNILQVYISEQVARDLRNTIARTISIQSYARIQEITPARLLTNLTSDVDSIKSFVSQVIPNIVSSVVILVGGSILLLILNWKLGLAVLSIMPFIMMVFFGIIRKVRVLFLETRSIIDRLNSVISESILGAALVRVLHSQQWESKKFAEVNSMARATGIRIVTLFSAMIPVITFASNVAIIIILVLGGRFVVYGSMSYGDFTSFNSYLAILIFPIFIIGFMGNIIAQAEASYNRVLQILSSDKEQDEEGKITQSLDGAIEMQNVSLTYGQKTVVRSVSCSIKAGSNVAIIGPTAAGKTQLLSLLIGLVTPTEGEILYDGKNIAHYQREALYKQIGLVFQDSTIFNTTLRENIAFNTEVSEEALNKAIATAELSDFITTLPQGLDTVVSERGSNLSGGQKQRIMLARALAINPKILLLDDFTARVDTHTEQTILANLSRNYPSLTLVSVTQKIASIEHYDQIIVLMEGEVIAIGTHEDLLRTSPEYVQIYNSQKSTSAYELQS